jgi:hypothetical protein
VARTLLQIMQAVCDEVGLPRPSSIIGSTDDQVRQLLALANLEGEELASRAGHIGGWPRLRGEHSITTVDSTASYAFPSDLQYFTNTTAWDRTNKWQLLGPVSPQEWQVLKSGLTVTGPRRRFRVMNNLIYIDPTPTSSDAGDTLIFEYYSNQWCQSSGGTAQSSWAADNDTLKLPERPYIHGIKWRMRAAKRLDYAQEYDDYQKAVDRELARAGMARVLPLNARESPDSQLITEDQIPDTGFGS